MKAAIIDAPGAHIRVGDFPDPDPEPGPSETMMTVLAAGIHPVVHGLASGTHYGSSTEYPLVPGIDGVARDEDGVVRFTTAIRPPWGTIAERVAARPGLALPDGADPVLIAATLNPGMSSWMPLTARLTEVPRLGTVVVVGATGVAGRVAVQSAFALGATRVIGIGRDPDRLGVVESLGAVPVSLKGGAGAIADSLVGTTPSLMLDYAWGSAAEVVWDALGRQGMTDDDADILHVQLGTAAGTAAALPGELLRSRRLIVRGSGAGATPVSEVLAQLPVFMERIATGEIAATVRAFPLSCVVDAWSYTGLDRPVVIPD